MGLRTLIWILILFSLAGCLFSRSDREWTVLTAGLPSEVKTSDADKLLTAYVLKQTHEPLFRRAKNQSYSSSILDEWTRNDKYDTYKFCIRKPKSFNRSQSFNSEKISSYLKEKLAKLKLQTNSFINKDNCTEFVLTKPNSELLFHLSNVENAPTVTTSDSKIEDGLGLFRVKSLSSSEILLERKEVDSKRINSVRFVDINSPTRTKINERDIEDFNYVPRNYIPDWVKQEYPSQNVTFLATGVLVLNIKSDEIRKKIFNCLDINGFRDSIVPNSDGFVDVASILPIGIKGAIPGKLKQNCKQVPSVTPQQKLTVKVWEEINNEKLKLTVDKLSSELGIEVSYKALKYNDFLQDLNSKNYDIMPVLFDTKVELSEPFFEPLAEANHRLINFSFKEIDELYNKLLTSTDKDTKDSLTQKIQSLILDKSMVIPLLQKRRTLYYPKNLKGLVLSDDYLEFPDVGRIEI